MTDNSVITEPSVHERERGLQMTAAETLPADLPAARLRSGKGRWFAAGLCVVSAVIGAVTIRRAVEVHTALAVHSHLGLRPARPAAPTLVEAGASAE